MRKIYISIIACLSVLSSCSGDFLELVPKGMNTLSSLEDTELLLSKTETGGDWVSDLHVMDNDALCYPYSNEYYITQGNTQLEYGMNSWDESFRREGLMKSTPYYKNFYSIIARMNTVISNCGKVLGDAKTKAKLISEARVRRAYYYLLLTNIFCKGYTNAEEAKNTQGIPFPLEMNLTEENEQVSLATVYEGILADLSDEVIANLPDMPQSRMRASKCFAYATRSLANLYTHNYSQAVKDADACLSINKSVKDFAEFNGAYPTWHYTDGETIYFMTYRYMLSTYIYTAQFLSNFEKGSYLMDYAVGGDGGKFFDEEYVEEVLMDKCADHKGAAYASFDNTLANNKDPMFNDSGLRTPQIIMVKAEAQALSGDITGAMNTLNALRKLRVHPDYYKALSASTEKEAMEHIMPYVLTENIFTCWTFFTRKRWNTMSAYARNYTRNLSGKTYTLKPESQYWVIPFAVDVTDYNSSIKQNY